MNSPVAAQDLAKLSRLVERLRAPDGCPWDRQQELKDLRAYLLEEAHEVAAAIDAGDWSALAEELGDLLFQIVFIGCLASEASAFQIHELIDRVADKMIDRHPHVFGDVHLEDADAVRQAWEHRKVAERQGPHTLLSGVPHTMPALLTAYRMGQKAAGVGFDWPDRRAVLAKCAEEWAELDSAIHADSPDAKHVEEEMGDLLFTLANLARHLETDPESALARANRKFRRRFEQVEQRLQANGRPLAEASFEELESAWQQAKEASDPRP